MYLDRQIWYLVRSPRGLSNWTIFKFYFNVYEKLTEYIVWDEQNYIVWEEQNLKFVLSTSFVKENRQSKIYLKSVRTITFQNGNGACWKIHINSPQIKRIIVQSKYSPSCTYPLWMEKSIAFFRLRSKSSTGQPI